MMPLTTKDSEVLPGLSLFRPHSPSLALHVLMSMEPPAPSPSQMRLPTSLFSHNRAVRAFRPHPRRRAATCRPLTSPGHMT